LIVALAARPARADDASVYQQKATAAFGLGEYKEAAENFEHAFKVHPDPALLFNAAQAHRLAGNKERALTLYENYLHIYGAKDSRAAEVQKHIDDVKAAIAHGKPAATAPVTALPPAAPAPAPASPQAAPPSLVTTAPPPVAAGAPVLVAQPSAAPSDDRSLTSKPWFWITVGGGVAVAAVVAILVASSGSAKGPTPSMGIVNGYPQ
jgi:tetratricopeptide (TPR) repeat protein